MRWASNCASNGYGSRGTRGATEDPARLDCNCGAISPDEVGMRLRLMQVNSKGVRPCHEIDQLRFLRSISGATCKSEVGAG